MDGISLFLVLMTALLFPIALAASGERAGDKSFVAWILVLEAGCLGSFLALDLLLFFLFFELTLVPVYFLIAGWGHERRGLRGRQVLPLHARRVGLPVRRHPGARRHPRLADQRDDLRRAGAGPHPPVGDSGGPAVPRLHGGLRREDADLPVPHLVARRLPGGAGGGLAAARRGHGQARHLRHHPLRPGLVPEGSRHARAAAARPSGRSGSSTAPSWRRSSAT